MDIYDMFMRIPPFSWENRPCFAQLRALAEILLIEHRHLLGSDWHLWHFGGSPTVPTVPTVTRHLWAHGCLMLPVSLMERIFHDMAMDQYLYISTIFRVMNIHLPAILGFTRGTRF